MFKGFRDFLLRGNVVDLAVAVVIGGAFGTIVNSLVKDIISPLISLIGGEHNFSGFIFKIGNTTFMLGNFLNAVLSFLIIAAVIYFLIVIPMNKVMLRIKRGEKVDSADKTCPECLSLIPLKAKRCKFCTAIISK
jgi:large conductance mechanosensitive channel